jgi:hypothetical protein
MPQRTGLRRATGSCGLPRNRIAPPTWADEISAYAPLAGRHPDSPHDDSGHGLRIAHELCDLVQLRSGPWGTAVRLHILAC